MQTQRLLTRIAFREAVLARDGDKCVSCGAVGVPLNAHHILERRLFLDGGYYLDNGATLCDPTCHMKAESTELSVEDVRRMAGITTVVLPDHLYQDGTVYDKWGNPILPNGLRLKGELLADESVRRVLAPVMDLFTPHVKAPRTYHLPWSPGKTRDDRVLADLTGFEGREVVVTVKMDGENTSIYGKDGFVHARSVEPLSPHPSRDRVKALAAMVGSELHESWRLTGENITAKHSIHYTHLAENPAWYFNVFNLWTDLNVCLPWDEVVEWATLLDLPTVPVLYRGIWDEKIVRGLFAGTFEGDPMEGYVVRVTDGFPLRDYARVVGKYVRAGHVTSSNHWRSEMPVFNSPGA